MQVCRSIVLNVSLVTDGIIMQLISIQIKVSYIVYPIHEKDSHDAIGGFKGSRIYLRVIHKWAQLPINVQFCSSLPQYTCISKSHML